MMTLEEVQAGLKDRRLKVVARHTGLAYDTVWRVASGNMVRVSYETVQTLSDYLECVAPGDSEEDHAAS